MKILLESDNKTVVFPLNDEERGSLITFLKNRYLKESVTNRLLKDLLADCDAVVFERVVKSRGFEKPLD